MSILGFDLTSTPVLLALLSPLSYGAIGLRVNRSPVHFYLVTAFVLGFSSSLVAYLAESAFDTSATAFFQAHAFWAFLLLVALPEETVKLASLKAIVDQNSDHMKSALIIGCFVGCGFAASENLIYLHRFGEGVVLLRLFTATAFHSFNGITMARIFKTSRIAAEHTRLALSLVVAVLLHGTYDYLITESNADGGRFAFVLALTVALGLGSLREYSVAPKAQREIP